MTDYIIAALCLFFFYNGWRKGFLRSILGPIALIIGGVVAYIYFKKTGNHITALGIGILGPFLLNFIFYLIIWIINLKKDDAPNFSIGRLLGGCCGLIWSGGLLLLILSLITPFLGTVPQLAGVQTNIMHSWTYKHLRKLTDQKLPAVQNVEKIADMLNDPDKIERIQSTKEFRALAKDEKIQNLIEDGVLVEQIQNKDFMKVMENPRMQAILQDEELIKKFLSLHQKLLSPLPEDSSETPSATEESAEQEEPTSTAPDAPPARNHFPTQY